MAKVGDTVVLPIPAGVFLRRELHFGIVVAVPRSEEEGAIEVVWDNGRTSVLARHAQLTTIDPELTQSTAALAGRFVRTKGGSGTPSQGVVVAAYRHAADNREVVIIETVHGLLNAVSPDAVEVLPNR